MEPSNNTDINHKRRPHAYEEEHHRQRQLTYVGKYAVVHEQNESGTSIPGGYFAEQLANFPLQTAMELQKDGPKPQMCHHLGGDGVFHFPSFYKCTKAGCNMRMIIEEELLHPDWMMVTYVGRHDHRDLAPSSSPWEPVDIMTLEQYIESLNPHYGIFLTHPSKLKHEGGTITSTSGMTSSQSQPISFDKSGSSCGFGGSRLASSSAGSKIRHGHHLPHPRPPPLPPRENISTYYSTPTSFSALLSLRSAGIGSANL